MFFFFFKLFLKCHLEKLLSSSKEDHRDLSLPLPQPPFSSLPQSCFHSWSCVCQQATPSPGSLSILLSTRLRAARTPTEVTLCQSSRGSKVNSSYRCHAAVGFSPSLLNTLSKCLYCIVLYHAPTIAPADLEREEHEGEVCAGAYGLPPSVRPSRKCSCRPGFPAKTIEVHMW